MLVYMPFIYFGADKNVLFLNYGSNINNTTLSVYQSIKIHTIVHLKTGEFYFISVIP